MTMKNYITDEESAIVHETIYLTMLLSVLDNEKKKIESSQHSLKPLYLKAVDVLVSRIINDLSHYKKVLREQKIKYHEQEHDRAVLRYTIFCRGYQNDVGIMKTVAKSELSVRLGNYIASLEKDLFSFN
jgi:hypothetical protein